MSLTSLVDELPLLHGALLARNTFEARDLAARLPAAGLSAADALVALKASSVHDALVQALITWRDARANQTMIDSAVLAGMVFQNNIRGTPMCLASLVDELPALHTALLVLDTPAARDLLMLLPTTLAGMRHTSVIAAISKYTSIELAVVMHALQQWQCNKEQPSSQRATHAIVAYLAARQVASVPAAEAKPVDMADTMRQLCVLTCGSPIPGAEALHLLLSKDGHVSDGACVAAAQCLLASREANPKYAPDLRIRDVLQRLDTDHGITLDFIPSKPVVLQRTASPSTAGDEPTAFGRDCAELQAALRLLDTDDARALGIKLHPAAQGLSDARNRMLVGTPTPMMQVLFTFRAAAWELQDAKASAAEVMKLVAAKRWSLAPGAPEWAYDVMMPTGPVVVDAPVPTDKMVPVPEVVVDAPVARTAEAFRAAQRDIVLAKDGVYEKVLALAHVQMAALRPRAAIPLVDVGLARGAIDRVIGPCRVVDDALVAAGFTNVKWQALPTNIEYVPMHCWTCQAAQARVCNMPDHCRDMLVFEWEAPAAGK